MAQWFKHSQTALSDPKILHLRFKHGMEGYGIFWALLETMHMDNNGYVSIDSLGGLSLSYGVSIDTLSKIVDCCLEIGLFYKCEHNKLFSKRMLSQIRELQESSLHGRKGAEIRWKNRGAIDGLWPAHRDANADKIREDKIRVDKNKTNTYSEDFLKFWSVYPKKTGKEKAWESWSKRRPPLESVLSALEWQIKSDQWCREGGQFIPNPSTYLNQGRWNDEKLDIKFSVKKKLDYEKGIDNKYDNLKMETYIS